MQSFSGFVIYMEAVSDLLLCNLQDSSFNNVWMSKEHLEPVDIPILFSYTKAWFAQMFSTKEGYLLCHWFLLSYYSVTQIPWLPPPQSMI